MHLALSLCLSVSAIEPPVTHPTEDLIASAKKGESIFVVETANFAIHAYTSVDVVFVSEIAGAKQNYFFSNQAVDGMLNIVHRAYTDDPPPDKSKGKNFILHNEIHKYKSRYLYRSRATFY